MSGSTGPSPDEGNPTTSAAKASRGMKRDIVCQMVSLTVPPLTALATAPMLAQTLGVHGRGELAAATAMLMVLQSVVPLGLKESMMHHIARRPEATRAIVLHGGGLIAVLALIGGASLWIFAPVVTGDSEVLTGLLRLTAAWSVPNILMAIPRALAAGHHEWSVLSKEQWVFGIGRLLVIGALFVTDRLTVTSGTLALLVLPVLACVIYVPLTRRLLRHAPRGHSMPMALLLRYAVMVWAGSLTGIIMSRVDQVLMVPLSNEVQLGLYAVAITIGEVPSVVSSAVRGIVFTADSAESDPAAQKLRLQQMARLTTLGSAVPALALGLTMYWWIPPLFGDDFAAAVPAAALALLATVVGTSGSVAGAGLGARGRPGLRSLSMLFGSVAKMGCFVVLIGPLGAVGAGISTLVGAWVAGTLCILYLKRAFGFDMRGFYGLRRSDLDLLRRQAPGLR